MIAIGTDILRVDRIEDTIGRLGERFVARILTPAEIDEYKASAHPHRILAKRFAAKEAIAKALGTGIGRGVSWQDIAISHDSHGAPQVTLTGGALRVAGSRVELSLADEMDYVVAFAVLAA